MHAIVEILCQSGDKKVLLEKAILEINNINEAGIPPTFRKEISSIKEKFLSLENEPLITASNNASHLIQNLTEDETDEIIHKICTIESFMNPN